MIYLTEMLGLRAVDSEGQSLGRVREVALAPSDDSRRVALFVVGRGRHRWQVPFELVSNLSLARAAGQRLRLNVAASALSAYEARPDLLLISKDLLDQQIIDTDGRKVVRVNDVHFQEQSANAHIEFRVIEVEVGFTGAVRRLFHGMLPFSALRAVEPWLPTTVIAWDFVDLIESDPLRRVKLKITYDKLATLHPADLADIVEELAPAEREAIFETLDDVKAADALTEVDPKVQKSIIAALDTEKAADILEEMAPDEAADLLAELPQETSEEILDDMNVQDARDVEELLEYGEHTAGGMMNKEFVAVAASGTVDSAVEALRADRERSESASTIFTIDEHRRLTAAIPLVELFLAAPSSRLKDISSHRLISVHLDTSENEVIELFDKYNLLALPVVDENDHLAGAITADDIISVLRARK